MRLPNGITTCLGKRSPDGRSITIHLHVTGNAEAIVAEVKRQLLQDTKRNGHTPLS